MSFFFDVWMRNAFILASDVRLTTNGPHTYLRKIGTSTTSSALKCAIVVCGEYPENCLNYFQHAMALEDTLRETAHRFGERWTERYSGIAEYSAVHLVGFERIPGTGQYVPQLWYWHNWADGEFISEQQLRDNLTSFADPIPANNHLPWKIKELTNKSPAADLENEFSSVTSFLKEREPIFSWNGDNTFWYSAAAAVSSAMEIVSKQKTSWSLNEVVQLAQECLTFLSNIRNIIPGSTVGPSPKGELDILVVTSQNLDWKQRADLSKDAE